MADRTREQQIRERLEGWRDGHALQRTTRSVVVSEQSHLQVAVDLAYLLDENEQLRQAADSDINALRQSLDERIAERDQARDLAARAAEEAARYREALEVITTRSHEVVNGYWRVEDVHMTAARAELAREDGDGR